MTAEEEKVVSWYIFWRSIYRFYCPIYDFEDRAKLYIKNITRGTDSDQVPEDILDAMRADILDSQQYIPIDVNFLMDLNLTQEELVTYYLFIYNKKNGVHVNIDSIINSFKNNNPEPLFADPNFGYNGYTMVQDGEDIKNLTFSIVGIDLMESDEFIMKKIQATLKFYRQYLNTGNFPLLKDELAYDNYLKSSIISSDYTTDGYDELLLAMARKNKFQIRTNGKRCAGIYLYCMRYETGNGDERTLAEARYLLRNGTFENQSLMDIFGLPYDIDDRQLDRYYSNAKACIDKGEVLPITG